MIQQISLIYCHFFGDSILSPSTEVIFPKMPDLTKNRCQNSTVSSIQIYKVFLLQNLDILPWYPSPVPLISQKEGQYFLDAVVKY